MSIRTESQHHCHIRFTQRRCATPSRAQLIEQLRAAAPPDADAASRHCATWRSNLRGPWQIAAGWTHQ